MPNIDWYTIRNQTTLARATQAAEMWARNLVHYEDVLETLAPLQLIELLPEGKAITDKITNERECKGKTFKARAIKLTVDRWAMHKRRRITLVAFQAAIQNIMAQTAAAGIPMDRQGAQTALRIWFR